MKRFIISTLVASVFFLGLGALVEKTGAKFKSDEKALELVRKARIAIGGDAAIRTVQSMRIVGQTTRASKIDGVAGSQQGETEIAMQFPDKLMKMVKIGSGDGTGEHQMVSKEVDVVVIGDGDGPHQKVVVDADAGASQGVKKIVIKKDDGTVQELTGAEAEKFIVSDDGNDGDHVRHIMIRKPDGTVESQQNESAEKVVIRKTSDGDAVWKTRDGETSEVNKRHIMINADGDHGKMRSNEMLRLTLGLLMTAPQGLDVNYTYGGEGSVDGTACSIVVADFGGLSYKIYLSQSTNLPVMMTYKSMSEPTIVKFRTKDSNSAGEPKGDMVFVRKTDGNAPDLVEYNVKFSDYRYVNNIQLPYKWTQSIGGAADETFDVTTYEINPANIGDKFKDQKIVIGSKIPAVN